MAQGILQPKSSRSSAWRGVPMMLAFTMKLVNTVFRTSVSMSRKMPMIYLYILLSGSARTLRTAARWEVRALGPSPAALSTQLMSLWMFRSGSLAM